MDDAGLIIRSAQAVDEDIDVLVDFRLAMFRDMGWSDEERLVELAPRYRDYVKHHFGTGDFMGWIAQAEGTAVGSVGLLWERVPPTVRNLSGLQAYVLAVYVAAPHRRKGIARALIATALEAAREAGADVVSLHYSPAGQGLYEEFGFRPSPEMRLFLDPSSSAWSPLAPSHCAAEDAD